LSTSRAPEPFGFAVQSGGGSGNATSARTASADLIVIWQGASKNASVNLSVIYFRLRAITNYYHWLRSAVGQIAWHAGRDGGIDLRQGRQKSFAPKSEIRERIQR
jgi:hypothetical protein